MQDLLRLSSTLTFQVVTQLRFFEALASATECEDAHLDKHPISEALTDTAILISETRSYVCRTGISDLCFRWPEMVFSLTLGTIMSALLQLSAGNAYVEKLGADPNSR